MTKDVGAVLERLRRMVASKRRTALERAIEMGSLVGERIRMADSNGEPVPSLRDLAAQVGGDVTPSVLSRAHGVYQLCARAPRWRDAGLSLSHLEAVLPLSAPEQDELLSRAVAQGWNVRTLRDAILAAGRGTTSRERGSPDLGNLMQSAEALLAQAAEVRACMVSKCAKARGEERELVTRIVGQIRAFCDDMEARLAEPPGEVDFDIRSVALSKTSPRAAREEPVSGGCA